MKLIIKIISVIIIVVTLYILGVFLFPKQADDVGVKIGTYDINKTLREFKNGSDNIADDMIQLNSSKKVLDQTRDAIKSTNEQIQQTQAAIDQKIDQTNKVIDSTNKVIDSTSKLSEDINTLTTVTGSTTKKKINNK